MTLSTADATAHLVENPFVADFLQGREVIITLLLLVVLGAVFLKGFKEAIGVAVVVVGAYLLLNLVVVAVGIYESVANPRYVTDWSEVLFTSYGNPLTMIGVLLLVFPRLALGLSGFETGVSLMPLVGGDEGDTPQRPVGRVRNTRKMLTTAAIIMSFYLLTTSFVTAVLIPLEEFQPGGEAKDRALAYLAHEHLGNAFGTVYDASTITILWFAGASALAGLLNIVPRYLPRYGMAPEWARAVRPLVLVYTASAMAITIIFKASVDAQAGAYATGVLAMMASAAIAVTISARRRGSRLGPVAFGLVTLIIPLCSRSQRDGPSRRHHDRFVLRRCDHPRLARLPGVAHNRATHEEDRGRRNGPKVHRRRSKRRRRDSHHRQYAPNGRRARLPCEGEGAARAHPNPTGCSDPLLGGRRGRPFRVRGRA